MRFMKQTTSMQTDNRHLGRQLFDGCVSSAGFLTLELVLLFKMYAATSCRLSCRQQLLLIVSLSFIQALCLILRLSITASAPI